MSPAPLSTTDPPPSSRRGAELVELVDLGADVDGAGRGAVDAGLSPAARGDAAGEPAATGAAAGALVPGDGADAYEGVHPAGRSPTRRGAAARAAIV